MHRHDTGRFRRLGGVVHDAGSATPGTLAADSALKRFDEFDAGNPIWAFFGDRGFFVFDETVSLVDALYH